MTGKSPDCDPIYLQVPIAIEGIESQPLSVVESLPWSFNLYLCTSSNNAFFKLQIPLSLRGRPETHIYLFIWPEQISSLTQEECSIPDAVAQACIHFSTKSTACLRFRLDRPAVLVVPKECPLTPKADVDRQILAYVQALTLRTELAFCIPKGLLPPRISKILREEWLAGSRKASPDHAALDALYGGSGGVIRADLPSDNDVSVGKPLLAAGILGKRRRTSSEGDVEEYVSYFIRVWNRVLEMEMERIKADLDKKISKSRATLKHEISEKCLGREQVDERLNKLQEHWKDYVRQEIARLLQAHREASQALEHQLSDLDGGCQDRHGKSER